MIFIDKILQWGRNNGFSALYGTPEQVNEMMTSTDFGASQDGTVMYCHLITDSETDSGRDSATVAVYFCRLCDFDFDGEGLLPVQEELKDTGKALLHDIALGNYMSYDGVRWQYGYDDYAENVAWVCLRVTLTALSADCYGREIPTESGCWSAVSSSGYPIAFSEIESTNGTLEDEDMRLCFANTFTSVLVVRNPSTLTIRVSVDGGESWEQIPGFDGLMTLTGYPDGTLVGYDWGVN
jgi:hypothetical protein